jgi:hypothetical protein
VRIGVLSLLTLTASINPVLGAVLSGGIIIVAWLCAGWAFRLTVYGTVFSWDFFTIRRARFQPAANDNWMFSAKRLAGVPQRTCGRLHRDADGLLVFNIRPWLFLHPRSVEVPDELARAYSIPDVIDVGLRRAWLKEMLGFAPKQPVRDAG